MKDEVDRLLQLCLDRPEREWAGAVARACEGNARLASEIRRRFAVLEEAGLTSSTLVTPGLSTGEVFGDFRILRKLGMGGMGEVFLAEQTTTGRAVALKVIRPEFLHSSRARVRFRREVLAASKLDLPGICTVYQSGEVDGSPYIAMRYLEGATLARKIEEAILARSASREACFELLRRFESIARTLHAAHESGLIHRDIKPGNIFITDRGDPVVLDFGLAQDNSASWGEFTAPGTLLGTPMYLAPEEIRAQGPSDRRSDVYSLTVTLYECLTLRPPFLAPSREALYHKILNEDPPDPRNLHHPISRDLRVVLETGLEKDLDRRYQTALDLAEDLRRVRQLEPIRARPRGIPSRAVRWVRRNPLPASVVVTLALGFSLSVALLQRTQRALTSARALGLVLDSRNAASASPDQSLEFAIEAVQTESNAQTLSQLHRVLSEHRASALVASFDHSLRGVAVLDDLQVLVATLDPGHHQEGDGALSRKDSTAFTILTLGEGAGAELLPELPDSPSFWLPTRDRILFQSSSGLEVFEISAARPWKSQRIPVEAERQVVAAAFSPSRPSQLAVVFADGGGRLLETSSEPQSSIDFVSATDLTSVSYSADGERLVTACRDGLARIWSLEGRVQQALESGQTGPLLDAFFSPDGERVAAITDSRPGGGVTILWSGRDLCERHTLPDAGRSGIVKISPTSNSILTGSDDETTAWLRTVQGEKKAPLQHGAGVTSADFSPDGSRVATGSGNGVVSIFDRGGTLLGRLAGHRGHIQDLIFLSDRLLLSASADRSLRLWDIDRKAQTVLVAPTGKVQSVAFTGDGECILTASVAGVITLWDRAAVCLLEIRSATDGLLVAAISATGDRIAAGYGDGSLQVFDATGDLLWKGQHEARRGVTAIEFLSDGRILSGSSDHTARLWSRTGEELRTLPHADTVLAVAFDPGRDRIACGTSSGSVVLWEGMEPTLWADCHRGWVRSVEFSRDGELLLTGSRDNTARLWSLDGTLLHSLEHPETVARARFSPDATQILTACTDKVARLWSLGGDLECRLEGHQAQVWDVSFDPQGRWFLTGGHDCTARLWLQDGADLLSHAKQWAPQRSVAELLQGSGGRE